MSYRKLAIAALCCATLSACVVKPIDRPYGGGYGCGDEPVVVDVAPPAPYYETVPVAPFVGAVWIGGYWGWNRGRHTWVPGRYEHPRPSYACGAAPLGRTRQPLAPRRRRLGASLTPFRSRRARRDAIGREPALRGVDATLPPT